MKEVIKFLTDNPVQYLATVGLDGRPKVRPFQFMLEKSGKLYFCTSNQKDVFQELEKLPFIELSTTDAIPTWIRLSGEVVFVDDREIKKEIIANSSLLQVLYESADNPIFEIFYLKDPAVTFADFSGNPPRKYNL